MAITADYHLHSNFSGDSTAKMEDMILSGITKGLTHMCFTEHHDMDYVYEEDQSPIFLLNTDPYLYELAMLKEKYSSKINILFGVELGLQPHITKELLMYARSYEFDFIIGSSHLCNRKDPFFPSFYENRSDEDAYLEYFTSILENIKKFSNFDVYGHLDYAVRYGKTKNANYSYAQYSSILDEILSLLIEKEKGIELNTGGFKHGLNQPNPSSDIIKRYKELGGEIITIGSDAHTPDYIGSEFSTATDILKSFGYKYYCIFENRLPEYKLL